MKWKEQQTNVFTTKIAGSTKTVSTPNRFHMGQGDVTIYVNGIYAVRGTDYKEVSPYSIEFVEPLDAGDTVVFHYQKLW